MFPLKDDIPSRSVPAVTYALIAVNALVFLYELSLGERLQPVLETWALVPAVWLAEPTRVLPFLGSMFLHGGWMHLLGNMLYLYIFGDNVEDRLGRGRFLAFYLICGLAAALFQVALSPSSQVPMIGASGAIAGVLGGYLLLYPRARVLVLVPIFVFIRLIYLPAPLVLGLWFVLQLVSGAASLGSAGGGVAYAAHVGGFIAGLVLVKVMAKRGDPRNGGAARKAFGREPELRRLYG